MKFNGINQRLACANDVNIFYGSVHSIKTTVSLLISSKEVGIEVNSDKTKYMVKSRDQNAGRSHNINIDNSSFERVVEFKYLGTTIKILFRKKLRAG